MKNTENTKPSVTLENLSRTSSNQNKNIHTSYAEFQNKCKKIQINSRSNNDNDFYAYKHCSSPAKNPLAEPICFQKKSLKTTYESQFLRDKPPPPSSSSNITLNKRVTFSNKLDAYKSDLNDQKECSKRYSSSNIDTLKKLNKSISLLKSSINKDIEQINENKRVASWNFDYSKHDWSNCDSCSCVTNFLEKKCTFCGHILKHNRSINSKKVGTILPIVHENTHTSTIKIQVNTNNKPIQVQHASSRQLDPVNEAFALDSNANGSLLNGNQKVNI